MLRVSWGSGSSLCPSTSGGCLVQEDRGWNSSRSWGREKGGEVSTKLQPRGSFHRNLVNHRLRWKSAWFAQVQCSTSSPTSRPTHHSHNAQRPKHLPPSKDQAAAPSPATHRQASGDTSATPALCALTVRILRGVSIQVPAPRDCSLPEEAHVPDGLVLQLRPEEGVGLGQNGDEPAAKGPNPLSALVAWGQGPGSRGAAASRGRQRDLLSQEGGSPQPRGCPVLSRVGG